MNPAQFKRPILVVDDEPEILYSLKGLLRQEFDVHTAGSAAEGAEILHAARLWPEYHRDYYGVFVRDPDGNNVEAVCHLPG